MMVLRALSPFLLAPVLLVVCGCEMHSSAPSETSEAREVVPAGNLVPDDVLRNHGLETVWSLPPADPQEPVLRASLIADGLLVATRPSPQREGRLQLIQRAEGRTIWVYPLSHPLKHDPTPYRYPAGVTGRHNELYVVQLDTVHIVDLRHGDALRREELPFPIATSLGAVEDLYFVGSDNGRVYGVDKGRHVELWNYRTGGDLVAAPVVGSASVVFASTDGSVYGVSPRQGWVPGSSWKFDSGAPIVSQPVPYSRWVIVGSSDYKLYCLEERDGAVFWSFLAEAPILDKPVVYSHRPGLDHVYAIAVEKSLGSEKRTLFAVKLRDGQLLWRRSGVRAVVSLGKDRLYVINDPREGEGRTLSALDASSGEEKFRLDVGQFSFVPTNLADHGRDQSERGKIYLVAEDGTIQVLGERL